MRKLLMPLGGTRLVAILTFLAVAAIVIVSRQSIFSPGSLSAQAAQGPIMGATSHASLAGQCGACHAPPWSSQTMADLCLKCHTDVAQEMNNPHSLHGMLLQPNQPVTCTGGCHTEHGGASASISLVSKDHLTGNTSGYSLQSHTTQQDGTPFTCVDCHPNGLNTFEMSTCTTCHQKIDPAFMQTHLNTFGEACLQCHDGIDTYGKAFDHNKAAFPLQGKHASLACSDCHQGVTSTAALKAAPQACNACHQKDDAHQGSFGQSCAQCHNASDWKQLTYDHAQTSYPLTGAHTSVACTACHVNNVVTGAPNTCNACHQKDDQHNGALGQNCAQCHDTTDWKQTTFDHSSTSYPLTGQHASVACAACHVNNVFNGTPTDCYSCHQSSDTHNGSFGTDCAQCHNTTDWKQTTFDHSSTSYPLTGLHASVACAACHVNNVFNGTPTDCYSCHQSSDTHNGSFGTDCAQCHDTTDWKQTTFDHSSTSYPLTGLHASVACAACHVNNVFNGTPTACNACHKDPHNGRNGTDCARCHNTRTWDD